MENLDIYILTSIVATLFIVFGIAIYREFSKMETEEYRYNANAKRYGRDALFDVFAKFFEDDTLSKKDKKKIYKAMDRTIADMESNGMYFPEDVKNKLKQHRDELHCEYSGLPSPKSYDLNQI
jgi:hypothetical protein